MNTDETKMTVQELDELCRLYMDCRLSVLEEKELEYILCHTTLSSPRIDDVRALLNVQLLLVNAGEIKPRKKSLNWRMISSVAASIAVIICLINVFSGSVEPHSFDKNQIYVAAYSDGHRLCESEAIASTDIAMARADSLMNYAAAIEKQYIMQAENIISRTPYN